MKEKMYAMGEFADAERAVLRQVQYDLPDSLTPYADMAEQAGMSEEEVLSLLQRLKADGVIRRFGASVKHQKAGYTHNAMVAWKADEALAESAGPLAARHPLISHCYYRPVPPESAAEWPYTFFTMIHGRNEDEYRSVIATLIETTPLRDYAVLHSLRELKKISMTYF